MAKFDGLEPWRCEDIQGMVAFEIGSKSSALLRNRPLECSCEAVAHKAYAKLHVPPPPPTKKTRGRGYVQATRWLRPTHHRISLFLCLRMCTQGQVCGGKISQLSVHVCSTFLANCLLRPHQRSIIFHSRVHFLIYCPKKQCKKTSSSSLFVISFSLKNPFLTGLLKCSFLNLEICIGRISHDYVVMSHLRTRNPSENQEVEQLYRLVTLSIIYYYP